MGRRRVGLGAVLAVVGFATFLAGPLARPAAADHDDHELWVTVAINAAGGDRITVTDDSFDMAAYVGLGDDVAVALGRPPGSFRVVEDFGDLVVELDDKLATVDRRGGLSYTLDTGDLQVLAQREGFTAVLVEVCTPKVRQVVDALVAPQPLPDFVPSRCRGWYQPVDDPAIRAVVQLDPDRHRYPSAVARVAGTAAIAFAVLGLGATLLRRGPLKRRSSASWLASIGSLLGVTSIGWAVVTFALWWSGAAADPVLISGGKVGEQAARTMLPGLAFLLPALLPGAVLLTVPRREKRPPAQPVPRAPAGPPAPIWWPTAWWSQWAARSAPPTEPLPGRQHHPPPPGLHLPPQPGSPQPPIGSPGPWPPATAPPPGSAWAVPGSDGG